jgi:hypothetical protein
MKLSISQINLTYISLDATNRLLINAGVQSINNVYANVNKVQNPFIDALIFDLIDNGVYVVYALYSRMVDSGLVCGN